jgi:hypothetical protein
MTYTPADLETALDVMLAADIGYWTNEARIDSENALIVCEDDEDARSVRITPAAFLDWLKTDGPAALINQIHDQYQKAAIADLVAHNWDNLDYDIETGDFILQQIVLGEIRYS